MTSPIINSIRSALSLLDRASVIFMLCRLAPIAALEVGMVVATWALFKILAGSGASSALLADPGNLAITLGAIWCFMVLRTVGVVALWGAVIKRLCDEQSSLGSRLFQSYLGLPYVQLITTDRSRLLEKLRIASRSLHHEVLLPVLYFIGDGLVAIAILLALFILSPGPTIVILAWLLLVFGVILRFVTQRSQRLAVRKLSAIGRLREIDEWTFRQARIVRLMAGEGVLAARQQQLCREMADTAAQQTIGTNLPRYISEFTLLSLAILLFTWFAHAGETSVTVLRELAIFTIAGMRLLPAGQRAVTMATQLQHGLPIMTEILEDLGSPRIAPARARVTQRNDGLFEEQIGLEHVSFGYSEGHWTIPSGTNLSLRRGEWLHVKGPSGAGKTTLIALLLGLLEPRQGRVTIDGEPGVAANRFRGHAVALVAQDSRLLPGMIAENLTFPDAPESLDADAASWLMAALGLTFDVQTIVGEDGASLSGGQRQRLAIVKALLTKPEMLVLDEGTSQLDKSTETMVYALVRSYLPAATVIVVAHKIEAEVPFDRLWEWCDGAWRETLCPR